MNLINRNGKYYLQLLDGEIEITKEDLQEKKEVAKAFDNYIKEAMKYIVAPISIDRYKNSNIPLKSSVDYLISNIKNLLSEIESKDKSFNIESQIEFLEVFIQSLSVEIEFPTFPDDPNIELKKCLIEKLKVEIKGLEYLNKKNQVEELNKLKRNIPTEKDKQTLDTEQIIINEFESIDRNKGWRYAFKNENDFNSFVELLTLYFKHESYTLPQTIIQLKIRTKTKVAKALREIHKELSNEDNLRNDFKFLELIRVLSTFNNLSIEDIYDNLTK